MHSPSSVVATPGDRWFTAPVLWAVLVVPCLVGLVGCGADAGVEDNPGERLYKEYAATHLQELTSVDLRGEVRRRPYDVSLYLSLPDFGAIDQTAERKRAFFEYLAPAVEFQNRVVEERRVILEAVEIKLDFGMPLSAPESSFLASMRERYRVPEEMTDVEAVALLDRRMDIIPASMVLSQAAMESAWGTSRFARDANNLFGQWCFTEGCGLVPRRRDASAAHEVAKFDRVDMAVRSYFRNINTHPSYGELRDIRQEARAEGREPSGVELVGGLGSYSARGDAYIEELRRMIRGNDLE